jgi:hypothetical protein
MEEQKDNRLKYLEIPAAFKSRASEISLWVKQSQRSCELLAKHVAKEKAKTGIEFERQEYLKDFLLKTSQANEKVLELLDYLTTFLNEVMTDAATYQQGATLREQMAMQTEYIADLNKQNEDSLKAIYDLRKNQINSK